MRSVIFCLVFLSLVTVLGISQPTQAAETMSGESASAMRYPAATSGSPDGQYQSGPTRYAGQIVAEPVYAPGAVFNNPRSFTAEPAWASQPERRSTHPYPPFGANLFQGYFAGTYYDGMNDNYVIMPGDRIVVHMWGAVNFNEVLMVDQQGNIFLPEAGPIRVAGVRHGNLNQTVRNRLGQTYRSNVNVYLNLLTAQPVAVYVTGFVQRPGRYAGGMNDSVLYYLDRAGGIIAERGSYRDISVQRAGKTIARVDLYAFIMDGALPLASLRDGDVIVVGPKNGSILADGLIPQHASYESRGESLGGEELIRIASPLPAASHVSVSGTRGQRPFHVYMTLDEFSRFTVRSSDRVEFLADRPGDTIMVGVSGSTLGATRYPVKRNTSLRSLLAHVPIDEELANIPGVYIKRRSVVDQQKKALADALYRLESAVLTATSANQESAAIRVQEAQLVQSFVQRASKLEPDGVVVVTRNGYTADIILEDGDEIVIPQKSDVVQISGEVMVPKAVVYQNGYSLKDYLRDAGGLTDRADAGNILAVHPNGEIVQASATNILPGDMLMVMPRYDTKGFSIFKDIVQVLYQIAIATKVVVSM